jgi:hypothetical protein
MSLRTSVSLRSCSSEIGGRRRWGDEGNEGDVEVEVLGRGWMLSMKSRRMSICASMCAVAYYIYITLELKEEEIGWGRVQTESQLRQYFRRLMFSSLNATPNPPASNNIACHRLRCATCRSEFGLCCCCCCSGLCVSRSSFESLLRRDV